MPPVAGKKIVIFGDSLSSGEGAPGYVLGQNLTAQGAKVMVQALVGRSANNFYGREDTAGIIGAIHAFAPDMAIVELGTNDLGLNMTVDGQRMIAIRDSLALYNGKKIPVYAFGPPLFVSQTSNQQANDVVSMMRGVFGGKFFDMRPITTDLVSTGRSADGVHFTYAGGKKLGDRMTQTFLAADSGTAASLLVAVGIGILAWLALR